jgi:hypothetical protein
MFSHQSKFRSQNPLCARETSWRRRKVLVPTKARGAGESLCCGRPAYTYKNPTRHPPATLPSSPLPHRHPRFAQLNTALPAQHRPPNPNTARPANTANLRPATHNIAPQIPRHPRSVHPKPPATRACILASPIHPAPAGDTTPPQPARTKTHASIRSRARAGGPGWPISRGRDERPPARLCAPSLKLPDCCSYFSIRPIRVLGSYRSCGKFQCHHVYV